MKKIITIELLQELINVIASAKTEYTFIQLNRLLNAVQQLEDYKEETTSTEEEKEQVGGGCKSEKYNTLETKAKGTNF